MPLYALGCSSMSQTNPSNIDSALRGAIGFEMTGANAVSPLLGSEIKRSMRSCKKLSLICTIAALGFLVVS